MAIKTENKRTVTSILNTSYDADTSILVVEPVGFDGVGLQKINAANLSIRIEYDGSSNPIYLGIAAPGTPTSQALWQIRKLTFDGSNNVTAIEYADGTPSFIKEWDERTTGGYVYS